jgi:hypothetical protein
MTAVLDTAGLSVPETTIFGVCPKRAPPNVAAASSIKAKVLPTIHLP